MSASDTPPSATPLTCAMAALITCTERISSGDSGISAKFLNQVRHRKLGNYLSCRGSLCNGIDPKQAGVGVRDVEGSGLEDNQRLSDVEWETVHLQQEQLSILKNKTILNTPIEANHAFNRC